MSATTQASLSKFTSTQSIIAPVDLAKDANDQLRSVLERATHPSPIVPSMPPASFVPTQQSDQMQVSTVFQEALNPSPSSFAAPVMFQIIPQSIEEITGFFMKKGLGYLKENKFEQAIKFFRKA